MDDDTAGVVGGLHGGGVDQYVIGGILEVAVDLAEASCLKIHCQGVICVPVGLEGACLGPHAFSTSLLFILTPGDLPL